MEAAAIKQQAETSAVIDRRVAIRGTRMPLGDDDFVGIDGTTSL
jgi:hypothetical protein